MGILSSWIPFGNPPRPQEAPATPQPEAPPAEAGATGADVAAAPAANCGSTFLRFLRELTAEERYHLAMAGCGLVANVLTNMMYPKMFGHMLDLSEHRESEAAPEMPFPLSHIGRYLRFPSALEPTPFNRTAWHSVPVFALGVAATWFRTYHTQTAIHLIQKRYRKMMVEKLMAQNTFVLSSKVRNYFLARFLADSEKGPRKIVEGLTQVARSLNSMVAGTMHLVAISPALTAAVAAAVPLFGTALRYVSRKIRALTAESEALSDKFVGRRGSRAGAATDVLNGIRTVMSFGRVGAAHAQMDDERNRMAAMLDEWDPTTRSLAFWKGCMMGTALLTFDLSGLAMIYLAAAEMKRGTLTPGRHS